MILNETYAQEAISIGYRNIDTAQAYGEHSAFPVFSGK